jgi:hypothetical protein
MGLQTAEVERSHQTPMQKHQCFRDFLRARSPLVTKKYVASPLLLDGAFPGNKSMEEA